MNPSEQQLLADQMNIEDSTFKEQYVTTVDGKSSLKMVADHCVLWDASTKQCTVYDARPTQCRTYPFWPQHIVTPYDWKVAALECEGISEEAPKVDSTTIMKNVVVHSVHQTGEDMLYHDMLEYLTHVDSSLLDEFENDLVQDYKRRVVYSDDSVYVQDNFLGDAPSTRSLHMKSQLGATQSEVFLDESGNLQLDRLVLDVHRAQCLPVGWMPKVKHAAVIGTGGGAVPMFLHHYIPHLKIDCIDISPHVFQVAQEYFGLSNEAPLRLLTQPGETYISDSPLDLLVVDVATASNPLVAPPTALISDEFLQQVRTLLSPNGVAVWNIIPENHDQLVGHIRRAHQMFPDVRLLQLSNHWILFASQECWKKDHPYSNLDLMQSVNPTAFPAWHSAQEFIDQ